MNPDTNIVHTGCTEKFPEPVWLDGAKNFVFQILDSAAIQDWECSVTFCDDEFIRDLNSRYRSIDEPTDVLSFESDAEYELDGRKIFCAGDVFISIPAMMRNATEFDVSANDELKRLIVHGILHLDGNDHGEFHIGKDGAILDADEKVPVYETLSDRKKEECEMLVTQESFLEKFKDFKIIE